MESIFSKFFNKKRHKKNQIKKSEYSYNKSINNISIKQEKLDIKVCSNCGLKISVKDFTTNLGVCPKCNYHFKISAENMLDIIVDKNSFVEYDKNLSTKNILNFPLYDNKLKYNKEKNNKNDALISGIAKINGIDISIALMDFNFIGGSMGVVVGEKITRTFERAVNKKIPVVIFVTSGGARMQEGMFSLMQMAKTSSAINELNNNKIPYITVLLNPTMGGVMASFSMLSDIIISEPNAKIGFSGEKIIKQIVNEVFPSNFQSSEFLFKSGMIDIISDRKNLKNNISTVLNYLC